MEETRQKRIEELEGDLEEAESRISVL